MTEAEWLTAIDPLKMLKFVTRKASDRNRMPILADALQDAGCDNEEILNHCRGTGPHFRGCWVVDLMTGRN